MYEPPFTQPQWLREHHRRMQKRPATIKSKACRQRMILTAIQAITVHPQGEFQYFVQK